MVDLSQPHDRLIKHLLSHPETADAFFRERLPEPVVARLTLPCAVPRNFWRRS